MGHYSPVSLMDRETLLLVGPPFLAMKLIPVWIGGCRLRVMTPLRGTESWNAGTGLSNADPENKRLASFLSGSKASNRLNHRSLHVRMYTPSACAQIGLSLGAQKNLRSEGLVQNRSVRIYTTHRPAIHSNN